MRRALRTAENDRQRYQQAIHFVTHEMRTPLTAIQGSSELMGRYNLSEEKRKQMADMINQESKRLARMIQTFLDVERLSGRPDGAEARAVPGARNGGSLHPAGAAAGGAQEHRASRPRNSMGSWKATAN